jgi:hypothetical protein
MEDTHCWTVPDCDYLIFSLVPDCDIGDLVLTHKYALKICSSERFYRQKLSLMFPGADIILPDPREKINGTPHRSRPGTNPYKEAYMTVSLWYAYDVITNPNWHIFICACYGSYFSMINNMLDRELINLKNVYDDSEAMVMGDFGCIENLDVFELLVDRGFDITRERYEITLLLSKLGSVEKFQMWIKKGLDIKNKECTALRLCAMNGMDDAVCFSIKQGASHEYETVINDWPVMVHAVRMCSVETVKCLVDHGVNIHVLDDMIFDLDSTVWTGDEDTLPVKPSEEMLRYLSSLQ